MRYELQDHDGELLVAGVDPTEGEPLTVPQVQVWYEGDSGEELYTFRDVAVWVGLTRPLVNGEQPDVPAIYVTWTDDTERNPRKVGTPANVKHTVEQPLPGGGVIGPFVLVVTDAATP